MHLAVRQVGNISVIDVSGRNPGAHAPSIRDAVARIHSTGQRRVVLNLSDLDYMDSAGIGDLVACNVRALQGGRPIKLAALSRRIHELLRVTRLTTTFDTYDTLDAALASFDSDPDDTN
jgi:anti-sigma B factor antagonist